MEIFNRAVALLFGFLVLATGVGIGLVTTLAAGPYSMALSTGDQWTISRLTPSDQLVGVILGVLVALIGLVLCALEILGPPREEILLATRVQGHRVALEGRLVRQRVQEDVMAVPGVLDVGASLGQSRRGVRLVLRIAVASSASVPSIVEQAVGAARTGLETGMGLKVDRIRTIVRREPDASAPVARKSPRFSER